MTRDRLSPDRRSLAELIGACSLVLLMPLMRPLVLGRVFVYNDLSWYQLPMRYLYQQALLSGDSVLWTPSVFAGVYLQGEGQIGLFHPFHQLLYRFLPLVTAFNLELVASYSAAFAGMFWFLHRLRFTPAAALFGAMLFAFSGFNLLHHHHMNMVAIVAQMPWLLATADVLIVEDGRRARTLAFAGVALVVGSECLLGFPQAVWWNLLALAAFAAFRAGETRRRQRLLSCSVAVAIGMLLGGIQILPTADAAAHSIRAGVSREFALTYSLHPYNLFQLWSPYFFEGRTYPAGNTRHEFGIYSGAILPLALIWVWIRRAALRHRGALIAAVTTFAGVSLLLALGRYAGIGVLLTYVPVLASLRAPARYIVLFQFALSILAAVTIDDLRAIGEHRGSVPLRAMLPLWIPAVLGFGATCTLNAKLLPYRSDAIASAGAAAPGVAIVMFLTLFICLSASGVRWALPALVVLTAIDLGAWGIVFVYEEAARPIEALTYNVPAAPVDPAASYAAAELESDLLVMRGYRLTSGYVALVPATRHPAGGENALRLSGTRWLFRLDDVRVPFEGGVERARLLDEQGRDSTQTVRLAVDRPGHLVAQVHAPGRRILAFTERFHAGWSATADGARLETVRVEGDFLGCVVDAGVHRVELRFMPRSFVYGAILSAIGVATLAGVLIVGRI
jgi:hypothetical protein